MLVERLGKEATRSVLQSATPPTIDASAQVSEPEEGDAASDSLAFDSPAVESEYQEARRYLLDPPAFQNKTLLLIGTLLLFVLASLYRSGEGEAQTFAPRACPHG
jgi:hypothetical protein